MLIVIFVAWLLTLALGAWAAYQLFLQNGRVLARVEALEQQMAEGGATPAIRNSDGVVRGGMLTDFALPALGGETITLSQWRGKRLLLVFFNPRCPFSVNMLPELLALRPATGGAQDAPGVVVVTKGSVEENERHFAGRGSHLSVLVQEDGEVASVYGVNGTPMACLVDEDGRAASDLLAGADAVLALAAALGLRNGERRGFVRALAAGTGITKSLDGSRLIRDGLKAGAAAPDFKLPRVGGSELSLSDFRGRRVLLAFSDPKCGPCDALAPKLEELHRKSSDPQVLMISRGDLEANRGKIDELGLTFPVVLQRQWEISKSYGIFATPVGYLVRADGTLAADVAVGTDAILNLAGGREGSMAS